MTSEYANIHENRKYKDTLFRMVFKEKTQMERCRRLEEYAIFVSTVRSYKKEGNPLKAAITLAIEECIEKGILLDILLKERKEMQTVVLETFNQELYEKNLKAYAYEDGVEVGRKEGIQEGEKLKLLSLIERKLAKGMAPEQIAEELEESEDMIRELMQELK